MQKQLVVTTIMVLVTIMAQLSINSDAFSSALTTDDKREGCIAELIEYLNGIKIEDEIMARILSASKYYRVLPGNPNALDEYEIPAMPSGCGSLFEKMEGLTDFDCYNNRELMGHDDKEPLLELIARNNHARLLHEAVYACTKGDKAALFMQKEGFYNAIMDSLERELKGKQRQSSEPTVPQNE